MTLFLLEECKKHKRIEEMNVVFLKKEKAFGSFPSCRKCMLENKDVIVFDSWKEAMNWRVGSKDNGNNI